MRRSLAHLALGGTLAAAAAAPAEATNVDLYFWGYRGEIPGDVQGVVLDSKPSATTYEITCKDQPQPNRIDECDLPSDPMTVIQGPSTYRAVMSTTMIGDDMPEIEAAQTVDCTAKDDPMTITCTNTIIYTYSKTTQTVTGVSTRHNFYEYTIPVNVTSGLDKLTAAPGSSVGIPMAMPTGETSVVPIWYPWLDEDEPAPTEAVQGALASIISADAAMTTYAIRCPPAPIRPNHLSSCNLDDEELTLVYGPSTFSWSQEILWDFAHNTFMIDCSVKSSDVALCTQQFTYAAGPTSTTGSNIATISKWKAETFHATVTAGLEKLNATPGGTVSPTAKVTGAPAASSTGKPTGNSTSKPDTANAAGQASAKGALIAGAAASAFLGLVLML